MHLRNLTLLFARRDDAGHGEHPMEGYDRPLLLRGKVLQEYGGVGLSGQAGGGRGSLGPLGSLGSMEESPSGARGSRGSGVYDVVPLGVSAVDVGLI